jgi:uncharacterized membrane protein
VPRFWRSPDDERLAGAVAQTWLTLDHQIQSGGRLVPSAPWARTALRLLLQAEACLASRDLDTGWIALMAAQRAMLEDPADPQRILRVATTLRREANKVTGWRAKAIEDLLCDNDGELLPGLTKEPQRVIDALALRDDQAHTISFRIRLRRRHLLQLFTVLCLGVALCLILSYFGLMSEPFNDTKQVASVILFGTLGAGLSVSQGLLTAGVAERIPAQQIGAFMVWMRPTIGAVAALVAFAILHANSSLRIFAWNTSDPVVVNVISFAAGFSERFITGAIERISLAGDKKKES